jgi:hypothetical protein
MMPALILVVSLFTLLMFFISYCRSLVAASSKHTLSSEVRDVARIPGAATAPDYLRLTQLLMLCPDRSDDSWGLQAIGTYYKILSMLENTVARLRPSLQGWMERERAGCANFAAVILDRRIAFNREAIARETEF